MLDCLAFKEKRNKLYYCTYLYIMLNDFINCPAFLDIKQTLHYKVAIELIFNLIKSEYLFYALFLMFVFHFFF